MASGYLHCGCWTWLLVQPCEVQVLYRFVSVLNDQGFLEGKYVPVIDGETQKSPAAPPATPQSVSEPASVASSTDLGSSNGDGSAVQEGGTDVPTSEPAPSKWDGLNKSHLKNLEPRTERRLAVLQWFIPCGNWWLYRKLVWCCYQSAFTCCLCQPIEGWSRNQETGPNSVWFTIYLASVLHVRYFL